jgi:hypothetical protein
MQVVTLVFLVLGYLWLFWGMYVLVIGAYRAYLDKRLTKISLILSLPFIAIGLFMDVFCNIFLATVLFLELPQELLVTDRLIKYNLYYTFSWRGKIADWICSNLLDMFDPSGNHC